MKKALVYTCITYLLTVLFKDTVVYERLDEKQSYRDVTLQHLEEFATDGKLSGERVYCLADRVSW